jgi:predicted DNA-binding transcriptional regulator AlpA
MNSIEQRALSTAEAARYVGLSISLLRQGRMAANKETADVPRHVKITDRKIVYYREDLDAWLDSKREATT